MRGRSARPWSSAVTFHIAVERTEPERSTFEGFGVLTEDNVFSPELQALSANRHLYHVKASE